VKFSLQDASVWERVSPYLDEALDLAPELRAAWLKRLLEAQPDIGRIVEQLLNELAVLDARGFLTNPPLPITRLDTFIPVLEGKLREGAATESLSAGAVFGAYQLVREIGYGGMSSVWLAERCDGLLKREVALKLPYDGPRRAQMAERFKREREILGTLTHPNIARLYDAGISASGQAYLAMEYVPGASLTEYCDTRRLSIRERFEVYLQILSAVEFAHSQLVLHRDLKPSNILVTDQGRVALLDFGIAKLLARDVEPERPPTEMSARVLTPDYASPEHIAGQPLDTTSDVYSLGVILYELLTGARPFGGKDTSRHALEQAVLTLDPAPPSQSVLSEDAAIARHSTMRRLVHTLRGDLDTIVLKALKKEPAERYRSVGAFAQDIRNYLHCLPISARADSAGYRVGRFVARYKLQVGAAAVALLAIIGGGAMAAWEARVAESQAQVASRERDKAVAFASRNGAVSDFMGMLISEAAISSKGTTVNELLARSEQLAMADSGEKKEDRAAILNMIATMIYDGSADVAAATPLLDRALALVKDSPDRNLHAEIVCTRAAIVLGGEPGTIPAATRDILRELENRELDALTASACLAYLSHISQFTRDGPAAVKYAEQALDRFHRGVRQPLMLEAQYVDRLAYAHFLNNENRLADRYFAEAMQKYALAGREHSPAAIVALNNWALVSSSAGAPQRALELYDRVLAFAAQNGPGAPSPIAVFNRARALEYTGRLAEARSEYERGAQLAREAKVVNFEVSCWVGLASIAAQSGDGAAARRALDEANARVGASWPANHPALTRRLLVEGGLDLAAGKVAEARAKFEQVLARRGGLALKVYATLGKAETLMLSGDAAGAVTDAQDALNIAITMQDWQPYSNHTGLAWLMLGRAWQAKGDLSQARRAYDAAVANLSNTVDADHPELVRARKLSAASGGMG
jgi:serine/threonine-protein kinase